MSEAQRTLYEGMKSGIEQNFTGFKAIREDGALMGPWAP
jgi:4-carboxymuconolactone decarboxylase